MPAFQDFQQWKTNLINARHFSSIQHLVDFKNLEFVW